MQITINISDEIASQAQARGLTPEVYVERLVAENPVEPLPRRRRNMGAFFEAMSAHSDRMPQLPEEAFTRTSFYQDHD